MLPLLNETIKNIPESLSININQIITDKKEKGEKIYNFSLGELYFDLPNFEISDDEFKKNYHYSNSQGLLPLRKKISSLYKNYYNVLLNYENEILISCGSKPIIFMLLKTILNYNEEVLLPEPYWLSYGEQIKLAGAKPVSIPCQVSVYQWEEYITPETKAIIINNPNNPSGFLYSKDELEFLLKTAKKYNLFVLSDEAYSDFVSDEDKFVSFAAIDKDKENCLVVNSLSKNFGIPGWRIGYAIAHKEIIAQLLKINQHIITCAATPLQDYITRHFDEIAKNARIQARNSIVKRKSVEDILNKLELKYLKGTASFYFMIDVSAFKGTTEEFVYNLLLKYNIATVSGSAYGESVSKYIRFAIGIESIENIEYALCVIKKLLKNE